VTAERARAALRPAATRAARIATRRWPPYSRLALVGEGARWAIDEDLAALARIAGRLGVRLVGRVPLRAVERQAVFFGSHFTLFGRPPLGGGNRVGTTYYHGRPGTPGYPEFDEAFAALRERHRELHRVQVSHAEMEALVLESGIDPAKVFRIPIGVDPAPFEPQTPELRAEARRRLGLPDGAFVVGSFQKDGVGWGDGVEPKLIKGPDVLVDALARLREQVPELHVLLSGPARGYVRAELERHGIPYVHRVLARQSEVAGLYTAIDAYAVPARQEGGPKGVLEAMTAGVPLVSTRVGQAAEIVRDGENGWLVDVGDAEALAGALARVAAGGDEVAGVVAAARETAAQHTYEAQLPLWRAFFDGFVEGR
jgi:glycosyltransferase involved in cell wall biosynthesis